MRNDRMKKLPIGIESFEDIRTEGFYYVDKTGLIKGLLDNWAKVNLFTRPRRFGKSLNMSMLKMFFEYGCRRELFDGLEISGEADLCEEYMGRFPVISVSLKGVNGIDYPAARAMLCSVIGTEAMRFQFLLESERLTAVDKQRYRQLVKVDETSQSSFIMSDSVLVESLKILSELLRKHYGKKIILLIDEYDVPLAKANERGSYGDMVILVRNLFEQTLKTNENLYFAVMTGCLRVAKESIFTGLNNLKVLSVASVQFSEYFGFTDAEVREMLSYYGLTDFYETVKEWYDGYQFGNAGVYCPWDVINYVDDLRSDPMAAPKNYWSKTSSNDVVRHFIERMGKDLNKRELECLIAGEAVEKEIYQDLTYDRIYQSVDHIWSILYMTGYLTKRGNPSGDLFSLVIPNMEIRRIFTDQIMAMFKETAGRDGEALQSFCEVLQSGDAIGVEQQFGAYLGKTVSIRDTYAGKGSKENFYHGILIGILGYKDGWYVRSNRESGNGYSDILIEMEQERKGIVIEVKYAQGPEMDQVCREALAQIEAKGYADQLYADGMQTILVYGIACHRKKCRVMVNVLENRENAEQERER